MRPERQEKRKNTPAADDAPALKRAPADGPASGGGDVAFLNAEEGCRGDCTVYGDAPCGGDGAVGEVPGGGVANAPYITPGGGDATFGADGVGWCCTGGGGSTGGDADDT